MRTAHHFMALFSQSYCQPKNAHFCTHSIIGEVPPVLGKLEIENVSSGFFVANENYLFWGESSALELYQPQVNL